MAVALAARAYCYHHEDFGIYTQALAHLGPRDLNPFLSARQLHVFNDHFDPILVLAAPLAAVMPAWRAALVAEALFVSAAAVPLAWLVRSWKMPGWLAGLLFTLLLLEPAVVHAVRFPIHPTTWAIAPMMFVVACVLLERWRLLLLALVLVFACKEEFPFCGLALGLIVWRQSKSVLALSVCWIAFVFVVRPLVLGETSGYGASLLHGFFADPLQRLTTPALSHGLFDFILPLLPLGLFAALKRRPLCLPLLALAAPLVAIRFLGMAWAFHYLTPLVPIAIGLLAEALRDQDAPPSWFLATPLLILAALDAAAVRFAVTRLGVASLSAPRFCPATPERLAGLDTAVAHIDGPALVSGNLVAQLAHRSDVYALGGFQPGSTAYRYVVLEKGELGDPYPLERSDVARAIESARTQAQGIIVDDERLFVAEGEFQLSEFGVEAR